MQRQRENDLNPNFIIFYYWRFSPLPNPEVINLTKITRAAA